MADQKRNVDTSDCQHDSQGDGSPVPAVEEAQSADLRTVIGRADHQVYRDSLEELKDIQRQVPYLKKFDEKKLV